MGHVVPYINDVIYNDVGLSTEYILMFFCNE